MAAATAAQRGHSGAICGGGMGGQVSPPVSALPRPRPDLHDVCGDEGEVAHAPRDALDGGGREMSLWL